MTVNMFNVRNLYCIIYLECVALFNFYFCVYCVLCSVYSVYHV